jgi:hypothetical protein
MESHNPYDAWKHNGHSIDAPDYIATGATTAIHIYDDDYVIMSKCQRRDFMW